MRGLRLEFMFVLVLAFVLLLVRDNGSKRVLVPLDERAGRVWPMILLLLWLALVLVLLLVLAVLLCRSASRPARSVRAAHSMSRLRRSSPGPRMGVFCDLLASFLLPFASMGPPSRCNPASNAATSVPARTRLFFAVTAVAWMFAVSGVIVDCDVVDEREEDADDEAEEADVFEEEEYEEADDDEGEADAFCACSRRARADLAACS